MDTPEQKRDSDRLSQYIKREQITSLMNNTKWQELRDEMLSLSHQPYWRAQCLRESPVGDSWDSDWSHHIPTYKSIEWMDINPIVSIRRRGALLKDDEIDVSEEIKLIIKKIGIPFSIHGNVFRIWGYLRNGQHVDFA